MQQRSHAVRSVALPLALAAAFPLSTFAQTLVAQAATDRDLRETVVTATRVAQPLADLVADVSIIDRSTIDSSGAVGVADLLARLPGVEISRNGGPGNSTSVFLRGAESRFTAVYIDGVRVDSQTTGGATWEQIPLSRIDRIEVLRGPAAAVYGSDAIGGVIQLFTKKGEPGKPVPTVGVGVGSQGTRTAEAGISGAFGEDGRIDYALGISHERSDGFNARPIATANPDKDGYRRTSGNARLGLQIDARNRIDATFLASNLNSQYDSSPTADDHNKHQLRTGGLTWSARWTNAYSTKLQVTDSRNKYSTEPSFYLTETEVRSYLFQNEYRLGAHLITAALERREDELHNAGPALTGKRSQNALALGYGFKSGVHAVQANVRRDDDSEFGGKTTGSASYGLEISRNLRATVSAGTSFRAPTLYHRFSEYGVASLKPEEGRNVEAGLRWTQGATSVGAVVYRNRVTNLINFGAAGTCLSAFGCYQNVGRAEYEGVTLSAAHTLGAVSLRGSVDFQDPRDLATDKLLARRSRRHASLGADTRIAGWTVGAEAQLSGYRWDNAANTNRLGGYGVLNLHASTAIARDVTLLARLDNVADKDYQLARTYATPGRVFYVGLKWQPQ